MPTSDEIEAARTQAGGWTKAQLAEWGVPWPPPKGWRKRLLSEARKENPTKARIAALELRIGGLVDERNTLLRKLAQEEGFTPCDDCFNGWCSMNCSSAPGYMKVSV